MIIIGIDVGYAICGWSILNKKANALELIDYGVVETSSEIDFPSRLQLIYNGLSDVIEKYKPEQIAIEDLFYFKNKKTVIGVGQVRGVILLLAKNTGLVVFNYTPLEVKTAVTGYGRSTKEDVQKMVKMILSMEEIPKPDDAADAIAIAICHGNNFFVNNNLR